MTTRTEKIRKLRALARSPNKHEAALALAKAQELERMTAKAIALAIAPLLEGRGLAVRVRRHGWHPPGEKDKVDAEVSYRTSRHRGRYRPPSRITIEITAHE